MAVLILTNVKNQTQEGYDGVLSALWERLKNAPGFIMHAAHPAAGEWKVYEVWQSKADADQFFATYVVPNLPAGIHPKRSYQDLHSVVTTFEAHQFS